jgi:hypothetical protein
LSAENIRDVISFASKHKLVLLADEVALLVVLVRIPIPHYCFCGAGVPGQRVAGRPAVPVV